MKYEVKIVLICVKYAKIIYVLFKKIYKEYSINSESNLFLGKQQCKSKN